MFLVPGTSLGHYHIVAPLGAGGMGEVYRATDTKLGRAVALKLIAPELAVQTDRLERFRREAKALAALDHPNIVTVFSVEETDGVHFLTMQLVEGQSLDSVIPDGGLPLDRILRFAEAVADALAAAHDKSIVHRDLKPANVMISADGRVKVLDFGLAKDVSASGPDDATLTSAGHTEHGVLLGTPAYMSPEQIAGRTVDHRTDIFSLGILLYQMASGQRPFAGTSSFELASAILRDTPPPVTAVRTDLPADFARLVRRCLEKDPRDRIQTAREVGQESRALARQASHETPAPAGRSTVTASGSTRQDEGFWVAVLPFRSQSTNADLASVADGLSEEVVTGLSRFSYLRVLARSSTAKYASAAADVRTVGKEIGARYVMEGSVRQAGSQLRVAVQLTDASTGAHLWAETYNRPFQPDALFDLQDDLVPRIVSTVADGNGVLPRTVGDALRGRAADKLTPYEAVLRGWGFYARITPDEHAEVRAALEHAVERAKDYADAWALLSFLYQDEYRQGFNPRPDPLERALGAARRAVDLAPANHFAHYVLASVLFFRRDLQAFRRAAERTITLNPMDANGLAYMGCLMAYAGDWTHGIELVDRGIALNPHHPGWFWMPAFHNAYRLHDYPAALDCAVRINMPGYFFAQAALAAAHGQLGNREAAQDAVTHLLRLKPDIAGTIRDEWEKWLDSATVEHVLEGLRKAGLNVAPAGAPVAPPVVPTAGRADQVMPSIAVLPFANMSADKEHDYFSDGLTEEIINALVKVPGLKVIARTSAFAFKHQNTDIRKIADVLGVTNILEGSVRRAGNRIRVTAQLIVAADGTHLWSERYDREIEDLFAIQDDIAAAIAAELQLTFSPDRTARPRRQPNLQAYEAYLRYLHHQWGFTQDSLRLSRECLEQAIALDPEFALPYAGLADHHLASTIAGVPADEAMPRTRDLARRALEADPELPEAHGLLGIVAGNYERDWKEAERRFARATARQPIPWHVRQWHSYFFLSSAGRSEEALREIERTIEDDPLSQVNYMCLGTVLDSLGRTEDARAAYTRMLELDPQFWWGWWQLGMHHAMHGSHAEARTCADKAFAIFPSGSGNVGLLAGVLRNAGESERADRLLAQVPPDAYGAPYARTCFHLVCGDFDVALQWASKVADQRSPSFFQSTVRPFQHVLRTSPAWPALLRKMNLTE